MNRNHWHRVWRAKAATFVICGTLSGASLGAVSGLLGSGVLDNEIRIWAMFGAGAVFIGAAYAELRRLRPPESKRETPAQWLATGWFRWAVLNGLALGAGLTSRIGLWLWYAVPIGAFVLGDPITGLTIGAAYGLSRTGASWLVIEIADRNRPQTLTLRELAIGLVLRHEAARAMSSAVLLAVGVLLIVEQVGT